MELFKDFISVAFDKRMENYCISATVQIIYNKELTNGLISLLISDGSTKTNLCCPNQQLKDTLTEKKMINSLVEITGYKFVKNSIMVITRIARTESKDEIIGEPKLLDIHDVLKTPGISNSHTIKFNTISYLKFLIWHTETVQSSTIPIGSGSGSASASAPTSTSNQSEQNTRTGSTDS